MSNGRFIYKSEGSTNAHNAHQLKNRYKDIYCLDDSRVVLSQKEVMRDYIHANFVKGHPLINDFICTQGPLVETINDFWRMCWQESAGYIVMLCELVELGKKKCERYIPVEVGNIEYYGDIKVTLVVSRNEDQFLYSELLVEKMGGTDQKIRKMYHWQWRDWPDRGVPNSAAPMLRVLREVRGSRYRTIVHCSAGVGRTGTLVAVEWILQMIMAERTVDMKEMIKELRNQRAHVIQTPVQYAYVAKAVLRMYCIVTKNNPLAIQVDMSEAITRILREKEEQILQLQLDLRRCESKNAVLEEVAQDAEDEIKRIRDEFSEYKERAGLRSEGSLREQRDVITRLEGDLADSNSARNLLQANVNRLEKLLDEERQSRPVEESFHPDISLCTSHEEEIKSLREEIEEAVQWRLAVDKKMKTMERELMEAIERGDDAMQEGNMLRRNLEEARDQLRNLECQLNDVKHNTHFASKGNSMFSEFVDERKKLEKDLKDLYEENVNLRHENRTLTAEIEELSLQKAAGNAQPTRLPCKCADLQDELYQVRMERDRALQASRTSMFTSTEELRRAGLLDASQRKRMGELRDEAKRYYVENDRLRRTIESLKTEKMNASVDMNTWKEKFEAMSREVDRLKDLLNALRRKFSTVSRPSNPTAHPDEIAKMCAKPGQVPQTPAASSGPSTTGPSSVVPSSRVRRSAFPPATPSTCLKRPMQVMDCEKRMEEMSAMEDSARAAELSINSSVRRIPLAKRQKSRFIETTVVKAEVQTVMRLATGTREETTRKSSLETRLRDATPPDESDEKSNCSSNGEKTVEEVKEKVEEEERMDEGAENHDPSFIMSKERMPADSNLEATVLEETMLNN